jgi:hypothetical protein
MKPLAIGFGVLLILFSAESSRAQDARQIPPAKETKKKSSFLCTHDCGSRSEKHYDVSNKTFTGEVIRGPRVVVADNLRSPLRYRYEWNSKITYSAPPDLWSKLSGAASPEQTAKQPAPANAKSPTPATALAGHSLRLTAMQPGGAKSFVKKGQTPISADSIALFQKAEKAIGSAQQPIRDVQDLTAGLDQLFQDGVKADFQATAAQAANTAQTAAAVTAAGQELISVLTDIDSPSTAGRIDRELSTAAPSDFMRGVSAQWADVAVLAGLQSSTDARKALLSVKKSTFDSQHPTVLAALNVSSRDLETVDEDLKVQALKIGPSTKGSDERDLLDSTTSDVEQMLAEVHDAKTNLENAAHTLDWAVTTNASIQTSLSNMDISGDKYKSFQTAQNELKRWKDKMVDISVALKKFQANATTVPDPFVTSFSAGCDYTFATTKQNALKLTIIDELPDKTAAAPADVLTLTVECASPFTVSAGVEFSTVPNREFAIQPVATPQGSTTTTNQFVLTSSSNFHPLPLGMVSARFCEPSERLSFHFSFGVSGNFSSQNSGGSSAEFLVGPSIALFRTMFLTPGLHIGKKAELGAGFRLGDPVPSNITTAPVRSSYTAGFGFAITFTKP